MKSPCRMEKDEKVGRDEEKINMRDFFRGACLELRVLHVPRRKIRSKIQILTASTSKKPFGSHPPTVFPPGNTDGVVLRYQQKVLHAK